MRQSVSNLGTVTRWTSNSSRSRSLWATPRIQQGCVPCSVLGASPRCAAVVLTELPPVKHSDIHYTLQCGDVTADINGDVLMLCYQGRVLLHVRAPLLLLPGFVPL